MKYDTEHLKDTLRVIAGTIVLALAVCFCLGITYQLVLRGFVRVYQCLALGNLFAAFGHLLVIVVGIPFAMGGWYGLKLLFGFFAGLVPRRKS